MHRSNKQRVMNKTFTILTNEHCSLYENFKYDESIGITENSSPLLSTSNNTRFRTFTKCKIKEKPATILVNQHQQRYFDSLTMTTLDNDEDDIPTIRCSNKTPVILGPESTLDETELSDLLVFTNPYRILSESMQVITSRHPSLQDLEYINDVSSVLMDPPLVTHNTQEHIYQELIRIDYGITAPPTGFVNDVDENKENRLPLMPIKCHLSQIPVWTPSPNNKNINTSTMMHRSKKFEEEIKKTSKMVKPSLTDLLDEWSCMMPKFKELLSNTRKMPLRIPQLTSKSVEFRRLKQLLTDMEVTSPSWTNAINQCRYVLQHAQEQSHHL